jgi:hypothetical protein
MDRKQLPVTVHLSNWGSKDEQSASIAISSSFGSDTSPKKRDNP